MTGHSAYANLFYDSKTNELRDAYKNIKFFRYLNSLKKIC